MQNVEFKAELRDPQVAKAICKSLRATWIANVEQVDTYYRVPTGRLKKREQTGEPTEVIFYDRPNRSRPKLSKFEIYSEEQARARFGDQPLPVWLIVRKKREIWVLGQVRIHLDQVEGLGSFVEFEAIVSPHNNVARCHEEVAQLRKTFGPVLGEPLDCSYSDLLARENKASA